ncbi:MAG TPA: hypothetical protein DEP84_15165 [Chloroflexi bacterium]|nr:hypothetical protein [Chloroflexota bacterium]
MPFFHRRLDPSHPYKPLDFGNGLLAGSVAPDGRLLGLGTYHPEHGYMALSGVAPFPDDQRTNQTAVRAYRAALAQPSAPTFGLRPLDSRTTAEALLLEDAVPHGRFQAGPLRGSVTTWAPRLGSRPLPAALQAWRFENPTGEPAVLEYSWDGALTLGRANYTQLTESGPLPPLSANLHVAFDGHTLSASAPEIGCAMVVVGLPPGPAWQQAGQEPLTVAVAGRLSIPPGQTADLTLVYALARTVEEAQAVAESLAASEPENTLAAALREYEARWLRLDRDITEPARLLAHRAQAYVLGCCALPVGEGICLLTDHQILPLSWTRDAYFLLQGLRVGGPQAWLDLLRRHVLWLFETARRPNGYWGRAYLANGDPKDRIFQLDQQCYPLLELAEYARRAADDATVVRLLPHLPPILNAVLARRAPGAALFATEETPADDPLPLPYHFSSQILLWHTFRQLSTLNARWSFTSLDLDGLAESIQTAVRGSLAAEHRGCQLFAYATDLQGAYRFYHDANDFPTVLAPRWGFCPATDPIWRTTMDFAFSPDNIGGYYPGPYGGLGSVHTPGPWPLGDVQEFLYARLTGDMSRAQAALARLVATACWDGALPEARDEHTGAVRSRHWFAWPGAALLAAG